MVEQKMYTEVLLELIIKASELKSEKELFQQCLPLYLRKLNCFSASIIVKEKRLYKDSFHMPIAASKTEEWSDVKNYFAYTNKIRPAEINEYGTKNGFYYGFTIENYGIFILGRKKAFSKAFYFDLIPIIRHFGNQLVQVKNTESQDKYHQELKRNEKRLQLSLEVNKSMVFENNFQTGESVSTPDLYHFLGYETYEIPCTIEGVTALIHSDDLPNVMEAFENHVKGKTEFYYAEFRMKRKNGKYHWVDGRGEIVERDSNNEPVLLLGISQDISERKKVERQLLYAKERAENSDRLKSAFLANMSHEIRTPMNGILGFAELLKQPQLNGDEQSEYIKIIERSGLRLLSIINDLVDISKVESGQMTTKLEQTEVIRQITYICDFFSPEAMEKGLELQARVPQVKNKLILNTDREKLYAILTNLVKNSIKYTNIGRIEVGLVETEKNIQFYVSDTGVGISEQKQDLVFDRFVQLENKDTTLKKGSGLGLSISKAYVEMLGGRIWFEGNEPQGTTFYFTLPKELVSHK